MRTIPNGIASARRLHERTLAASQTPRRGQGGGRVLSDLTRPQPRATRRRVSWEEPPGKRSREDASRRTKKELLPPYNSSARSSRGHSRRVSISVKSSSLSGQGNHRSSGTADAIATERSRRSTQSHSASPRGGRLGSATRLAATSCECARTTTRAGRARAGWGAGRRGGVGGGGVGRARARRCVSSARMRGDRDPGGADGPRDEETGGNRNVARRARVFRRHPPPPHVGERDIFTPSMLWGCQHRAIDDGRAGDHRGGALPRGGRIQPIKERARPPRSLPQAIAKVEASTARCMERAAHRL